MRRREEEVEVEEQIVPARHNEERANAGSSALTGAGGGRVGFIVVTANSDLSNWLLHGG